MYKYIRILSLDVVTGGVITAMFVCKAHEVQAPANVMVTLGLAIWIIYTYDHLQDARKITHIPSTERHLFHQNYFKYMVVSLALAVVAMLALLWQLPPRLVAFGAILLAPIGLYFLILLKTRGLRLKEIWVGLGYALGVSLPAAILFDLEQLNFSLFGQIALLAIGNLLIFSVFEIDADKKDGGTGMAQTWGIKRTRNIVNVILVSVPLLSVIGRFNLGTFLITGIMALVLLLINNLPNWFRRNELYRTIGDAVFFIPAFYLLM